MTLKFTFQGIEVTANDAAEAAALIRELASPIVAPKPVPENRLNGSGGKVRFPARPITSDGFDVAAATLRFLSQLQSHSMVGQEANEFLMDALHSAHPKGIGVKLGWVNKFIRSLGFDPDHVYENPRTAAGRVWKGKAKLDAAREAARRAVEGK